MDTIVATDTVSVDADYDNGATLQRLPGLRGYDGEIEVTL
jgi:hypothetical protein